MPFKNRLFWTVIIFILNALIVIYLLRDAVFYSQWFVDPASPATEPQITLELQQSTTIVPEKSVSDDRASKKVMPPVDQFIEAHEPTANCKTQANTSNTIYQWKDEDGVVTLSNRKPPAFREAQLVAEIKPDNVIIDLIGDQPMHGFRTGLRNRVDAAIKYFAQVTDQDLITPVIIKIRLFNDKTKYAAYRQQVAPSIGAAPAFYSSAINQSAVYLGDSERGLNSAIHEAMHAINRAWFGNMATWLNEGMAEMAESTAGNSEWQGHSALVEPSLSLSELVNAPRERWRGIEAQAYYALSWAFTAYLFEQHSAALATLLLREASNGCQTLTAADLTQVLKVDMDALTRDFNQWVRK